MLPEVEHIGGLAMVPHTNIISISFDREDGFCAGA